jgi:hypothetical protein
MTQIQISTGLTFGSKILSPTTKTSQQSSSNISQHTSFSLINQSPSSNTKGAFHLITRTSISHSMITLWNIALIKFIFGRSSLGKGSIPPGNIHIRGLAPRISPARPIPRLYH